MNELKITKDDIYAATEGGKAIILHFYPQSAPGFSGRRNFSIRGDDKKPSCTVFCKDGVWFLQDKGGADTKAYTAIEIVRREMGWTASKDYPKALEWCAEKFAPDLLQDRGLNPSASPRAEWSKVTPQHCMTVELREGGQFTAEELLRLGPADAEGQPKITQQLCDDFCLKPMVAYISPVKPGRDFSSRQAATPQFPMYYYDYGDYGKIYQPLGELRFLWKDKTRVADEDDAAAKEARRQGLAAPKRRLIPFSGEREFMRRYLGLVNHDWTPTTTIPSEDGEGEEQHDATWDKLIICSGPSDALNVHRLGYHVCWPNSETADITPDQYSILSRLAKQLYLLFDLDETGLKQAQKNALSYLDIAVIQLPADLSSFRHNGKPCKDAKDFFMHYRRSELGTVDDIFDNMVKMAGSLKFWQEKKDKAGHVVGFDVNNSQMYAFLESMGFHTIDDSGKARAFCHVQENVVELIPSEDMKARCMQQLQQYLQQHPVYYKQSLVNSIYRSKQISTDSFVNLRKIKPDFHAFSATCDYFFFRNGVFKVTAEGISRIDPDKCPYMVHSDKIIDHDLTVEEPFFEVRRTPEYQEALTRLRHCSPRTPEYNAQKKKADAFKDTARYEIDIKRPDFDWLQFVYNTGRIYWQEEQAGYILTTEQRAEHNLNFLAKLSMLGYLLSKHKDAARPYFVYAMETEQGADNEHRGGTGKSMLMGSIARMRRQNYIDGQHMRHDKMDFILQGVKKDYTDTVYIDDLNSRIDLHVFMNWVTGNMVVNPKNQASFVLNFDESPKLALSSNHPISSFDASLRRRCWFAAFGNYYHAEDPVEGLKAYTPDMDFHRTLFDDYTEQDWNHFYNFMLQCVQLWKRFPVRIQPAMRAIEMRNLLKAMTQEFLDWAELYFNESTLNQIIDISNVFEDYKKSLPKPIAEMMKKNTFSSRLQCFCLYKDWVYNPRCLLRTKSERATNRIRAKVNGEDRYFFYIDTTKNEDLPVSVIFEAFELSKGRGGGKPVVAAAAAEETPTLAGMGTVEEWEKDDPAAAPQGEEKPIFG